MKEPRIETQPAIGGLREFTDTLRKTDPDVVPGLAAVALDVLIDHQNMSHAVYWLLSHDDAPRSYAEQRLRHELQATQLAEKLEIQGDPLQIAEIVSRYVERAPTPRGHRG